MTRKEVIAYIQDVKFGYLATIDADHTPRVRPVGMYTVYGDHLYFFTMANTRKAAEIDNNPQVEVVWSKLQEQSQVRISGQMVVAPTTITAAPIKIKLVTSKPVSRESKTLNSYLSPRARRRWEISTATAARQRAMNARK